MAEIRLEERGGLEIWTFARPQKSNAISQQMAQELEGHLIRVAAATSPRVVILTGEGPKAFCAGADLKERRTMTEAEVRAFLDRLRRNLLAFEKSGCVFIAALNGLALGGGLEIALACDLRVAASHAELALTEVKLGIIPGGGGTQRLPRLIGPSRAKELILTGRRVGAEEALRIGLVNQVTSADDLLPCAIALGESILANAPLSVRLAKQAIDQGLQMRLEDGLLLELEKYEHVLKSEDRLEALKAFEEKRPPRFSGR